MCSTSYLKMSGWAYTPPSSKLVACAVGMFSCPSGQVIIMTSMYVQHK